MVSCHPVGTPRAQAAREGCRSTRGGMPGALRRQRSPLRRLGRTPRPGGRRSGRAARGPWGPGRERDRGGRPARGSVESGTAEAGARCGLAPLRDVPSRTRGCQGDPAGGCRDDARACAPPPSRGLPAKSTRTGQGKRAASEALVGFLEGVCGGGQRPFWACDHTGLILSGSLSGAVARG